jgi:hypothetical protein
LGCNGAFAVPLPPHLEFSSVITCSCIIYIPKLFFSHSYSNTLRPCLYSKNWNRASLRLSRHIVCGKLRRFGGNCCLHFRSRRFSSLLAIIILMKSLKQSLNKIFKIESAPHRKHRCFSITNTKLGFNQFKEVIIVFMRIISNM